MYTLQHLALRVRSDVVQHIQNHHGISGSERSATNIGLDHFAAAPARAVRARDIASDQLDTANGLSLRCWRPSPRPNTALAAACGREQPSRQQSLATPQVQYSAVTLQQPEFQDGAVYRIGAQLEACKVIGEAVGFTVRLRG